MPHTPIATSKPHSARVWNYFVGGKDNYEVDREIGDHIKEIFPGLVDVAVTSSGTPAASQAATSSAAGRRPAVERMQGMSCWSSRSLSACR